MSGLLLAAGRAFPAAWPALRAWAPRYDQALDCGLYGFPVLGLLSIGRDDWATVIVCLGGVGAWVLKWRDQDVRVREMDAEGLRRQNADQARQIEGLTLQIVGLTHAVDGLRAGQDDRAATNARAEAGLAERAEGRRVTQPTGPEG